MKKIFAKSRYYYTSIFENYLFVIPAITMFLLFWAYPCFKVFQLSLQHYDGISPTMTYVGLSNFKDILFNNPTWWSSVGHAAYITFLALTVQNAVALVLALIVDRELKGAGAYRMIYFLPPVLSHIVVGLIWWWIYNGDYGLLNYWLTKAGLGGLARAWLADPGTALTCVAVVHMWKGFGWGFIILLAGLQNIPRQLYEAARIDGANTWQVFKRVTIPLMMPVFILVMILTILDTMQIYALIASMTGGGPGYHTEVPITRILNHMIASSEFGYACAMGLVLAAILVVVSMVQVRLSRALKQT